jgi:hypothetical protein
LTASSASPSLRWFIGKFMMTTSAKPSGTTDAP